MEEIRNLIKTAVQEVLKEKSTNQKYYRVIPSYEGNVVVFEPKGYYEAFDDDCNPIFHTDDIMLKSDKPEIAASKTIGGAILGAWSMFRTKGTPKKNCLYL